MKEIYLRTEKLFGKENMDILKSSRVAVFGAGGVGGNVIEALARSGVGHIDIIDMDTIDITNINRQIFATLDTVGRDKTEAAKERILQINPEIEVNAIKCFFLPENADQFDFKKYDFVVDAIDNVTAKIELVMRCKTADTPIICSMGTGNKIDPSRLQIADIYDTSVCPLARVMRRELKKRNIKKLPVLFSTEEPMKPVYEPRIPGSTAFVPPSAGLLIASYVVRKLISL